MHCLLLYHKGVSVLLKKKVCRVEGCPSPVRARLLCNRHYQQARRGSPFSSPTPDATKDLQRHGSPDGFGRFGLLDEDDLLVKCHECGHWVHSLAHHAIFAHSITAREYRQRHGLPPRQPLLSKAAHQRRQESWHQVG
ncbi:MucR family transcriptional regulator [Jonesia quinghaiensis]|uniref:MucR family transcriptional regulator n=1 Tax=Jonesia quinghaiensis TaxID=262806 RepID=UPI000A072EA6